MDPVNQIDFIRSREVNVPYEGFIGALQELYREGPLTILFAAVVGVAIGGLMLLGAAFGNSSMIDLTTAAGSTTGFLELAAGASAVLTTLFVGTRGYLEGRHDALEKNTLIDHMADLHKNEVALQGLAVKKELETEIAKREGTAPKFIKEIISSGRHASPASRAESILAMRSEMSNTEPHL